MGLVSCLLVNRARHGNMGLRRAGLNFRRPGGAIGTAQLSLTFRMVENRDGPNG